jgi:alpha-mannosidase
MYAGAGHEWFSVQHWAAVEQNGLSVAIMPLDAPLMTFGDINRNAWPTQFGERSGTIFSYVMNNYWEVNYRASQGGPVRFRYVLTSAPATDAAALSRMGWAEMTPLEADEITRRDKATESPRLRSCCKGKFLDLMRDQDLLLQAWKPAEDGRGTILRFLDLGGPARSVEVHLPLFSVDEAWQTDAVERDQAQLPNTQSGFTLKIHPHEIVTVRVASGQPVNKVGVNEP